jgi:cytochrome c oxidase subunit 1
MATVEAAVPHGGHAGAPAKSGLWSWITTVDHKRIGILYGATALFFFLVAGLEALLLRIQLARPENDFLSPDVYNQLFTMHGTTMVFLVGMPMAVAFFNYIVPLQIGARDVAFPRLNALSYWIFLLGGLFMNASFLFGAPPNNGWFGYAPLTGTAYSPGLNMDFWGLGLQILGIASIMGGVNFITTILNMRAPGMRYFRMPVFTHLALVTSFLIVTALPVLAVALFYLTFDRFWGTQFYVTAAGGNPYLWQHLFWIFGHPEVYILILPAFGIISDVIPTFSRKPLFGYALVVFSGILIGFIGWGVWAHHMFSTGMGPIADAFFSVSTLIIAIPTGVKIFNWLATMWGGKIRFEVPMLFAVGTIAMFTMGGVTGILLGSPPVDLQVGDTYFVVGHFHYVLFGGLVLGIFSGLYYWWPKVFAHKLGHGLGLAHFWLMILGMNLTFFPMHFAGLLGMPRRIFTYSAELGLETYNLIETVGGFVTALGVLVFAWNVWKSRKGERVGPNPWGGFSLEWATTSPPAEYNFAAIPIVRSREPLWDAEEGILAVTTAEPAEPIHLPNPSYWPLLTAVGITATFALFMTNLWWPPLVGFVFTFLMAMNWAFEPTGH